MAGILELDILTRISEIVTAQGNRAYVVGGYVRDHFLGRKSKDIDIVVVGSGIALARSVASSLGRNTRIQIFRNFGTAMVRAGDLEIEFVGARRESYRRNSRKPVVEDGSLEEDQQRRDFTINAMAVGLHASEKGQLIDPFRGLHDLDNRIIRTPLDPVVTFDDDPLRMLRAVRFASQLGFRLDGDTFRAIQDRKERISIVSVERVMEEVNKIILSPKPSVGFRLLDESGLLALILPEIEQMKGTETIEDRSHKENFNHTVRVLDNVSLKTDDLWLRWAALLHDVAKPFTKKYLPGTGWTFHGHEFLGAKMVPKIFRRLKLPLHEKMKFVQKMVLLHLRPIALVEDTVTDAAVRRLLFEAGDDIESLMMLCEADITSKNEKTISRHLKNFRIVRKKLKEIEEKDKVRNFQPPIRGDEIIEFFGIPPSETVGIIKNTIKDAILDGKIRNDREEALAYMIEIGKELGLQPKR